MLMAPPLAEFALGFGPPEYASLMFLGLTILSYVASGSILKAFMMAGLGLILGSAGTDIVTGDYRFTYGLMALEDGVGLVPVAMGFFGVAEVLWNIEHPTARSEVFETKIKGLLPSRQDWRDSIGPIGRGSIIGFFLGILPGGGPLVASFMSYGVEKKLSRNPERFGKGEIAGVAAPESANNAGATTCFIPMLAMGVPPTAGMALILGALIIYGLEPGPFLIKKAPDLFWGTVASMYTGNLLLLVLNLPLIPLWVRMLKIPYPFLFPMILLFCLIGSYSINNNFSDVVIMTIFGILGYLMKKMDYEGAPMVLALVIGPMFENALRQSLIMSHGSFLIFLKRPISIGFLTLAALLLLSPLIFRRRVVTGFDE